MLQMHPWAFNVLLVASYMRRGRFRDADKIITNLLGSSGKKDLRDGNMKYLHRRKENYSHCSTFPDKQGGRLIGELRSGFFACC